MCDDLQMQEFLLTEICFTRKTPQLIRAEGVFLATFYVGTWP